MTALGEVSEPGAGARRGPGGAYRRCVRITGAPGRQQAEMEDDFHHFVTAVRHDGGVIQAVEIESVRTPWATCFMAARALETLAGQPLEAGARLAAAVRNAGCTHMLDQVALAIAHAARATPRLDYRMEVEAGPDGAIRAQLFRDGAPLLDWRVEQGAIVGGVLDGVSVTALPRQAADRLAPDLLEAAMVLRRAVRISGARSLDLDDFPTAGAIAKAQPATCYSLLPEIRDRAHRNKGTMKNFSAEGRWPLAEARGTPS
ncbi:DUF2889 domain-containing protein [Phenylobacterium sp.]|uniref:DUF2889 domain-containing protein n=1 Tax=Phenylobacterium sp. TaxID=1871053 RepID=UPI002F3FF9B7